MDIIQSLNLATAGELALISFLIGVIVQAIKQTGKVDIKYLPFLSMLIGIVAGLAAVAVTKDTNYLNGAIAGLITGAATSGLVDGVGSVTTTVSDKKVAKQQANQDAINQAVAAYLDSKQTAANGRR